MHISTSPKIYSLLMEQQFWTDSLVMEYLGDVLKGNYFFGKYDNPEKSLQQFKASKQQSVSNGKDYEIIAVAPLKDNEIYQVRRLPDSEIFSIGEKLGDREGDYFKKKVIEKFILYNDKMYVIVKDGHGIFPLKHVVKRKQPLFTTNDNVPIYEGQNYWRVCPDFTKWLITNPSYKRSENELYFSTEEKANEHILLNKPLKISVQELMNRLHAHFKNPVNAYENLKELYQSKIKNQ